MNNWDHLRRQVEQQGIADGLPRFMRENQPALDLVAKTIRDSQGSAAIVDILATRSRLPGISERLGANAAFVESALAALGSSPALSTMASFIEEHQRQADRWQHLVQPFPSISAGILAQIESTSAFAGAAASALKTINFDAIGSTVGTMVQRCLRLERLTLSLSDRHSSIISSFSAAAGLAASFPPFVAEMPSLDLYVHNESVRAITPHESYDNDEQARFFGLRVTVTEETDAFLETTLVELNPALLWQLQGLLDRASERGPDWWSQAAASGRKLLLGVLHGAAPDDLVLPWVTDKKKQLDRNGHPTRGTKVAWLCQFVPNDSYRKFVKTDVDSALALIDIFDSAVHIDEFPEFEETFSWTTLRLKTAMRHILTIWKDRQEH